MAEDNTFELLWRELQKPIQELRDRVSRLESIPSRAEVSGGHQVYTVASLPTAGQQGREAFASDGRKVGEGAGAGTGVMVYDDGVAWRRCSDDTTVVA